LTRAKRVASVRCVTYCNLYSLDSSQFERVLESYPLMRRTMESVAAERLNKLGKNPSIISTRHDLKRDAAVLKDMIDRVTPQPSSGSESESDSSSNLSNQNKRLYFKSSLSHLHDEFKKSFIKSRLSQDRRKSSTDDKKIKNLTRIFLDAPNTNTNTNQIKKSPSTPFSIFHRNNT
jgi:CRP-like cAMP-binding protein